jgi:hypothetical protein
MSGPALYLYALLAADPRLEPVEGLGRAPVETLDMGACFALVSRHDGSEILQTRRNMMAHTRVLEAGMRAGALLPMRFGSVARDADTLRGFVAAHAGDIAAQLDRLAGCIEIGVTVGYPRDAALAALSTAEPALVAQQRALAGRGAEAHYARIELGRRVAETLDRRRKAAERAMLARLAPLARAHVLKAPEQDVATLRAAFLIAADDEPGFLDALSAAARESDFAPDAEPDIACVSPAPPYNFVDLRLSLDAAAGAPAEA